MSREPPQTVGHMRRKAVVTDIEIAAAVDAYLAHPKGRPHRFASGHTLDVRAAVAAHQPSHGELGMPGISDNFRRTLVRTAVILAVPSRP